MLDAFVGASWHMAHDLRLAVVYNGSVANSKNCASQSHRNAADLPLYSTCERECA
jgi:hypothetical protein